MSRSESKLHPRIIRAALAVLAATVFVILFGAIVRITGSGAGCGQHWPSCQGEIAHVPQSLETLIELTHRITSGLLGFGILGLLIAAFRVFERGHPTRIWLVLANIFLVIEALLGRALVRDNLVAGNTSVSRAVMMPLHLVNTSLLLATLTVAVFFCFPRPNAPSQRSVRGLRLVLVVLAGVLGVSASGALTALGDTLYPVQSAQALSQIAAESATSPHFLEQLRAFHPVLAVALVLASLRLLPAAVTQASPAAHQLGRVSVGLLVGQALIGAVNILLSAPGWMQVVHLGIACLLWMALVLLAAELWSPRLPATVKQGISEAHSDNPLPRAPV